MKYKARIYFTYI